jgi:hypothetical protein
MRTSLVLVPALLVGGSIFPVCSQMVGYYPKGGPDIAAEEVSLIQLIANPQAYDNKPSVSSAFSTWSSRET